MVIHPGQVVRLEDGAQRWICGLGEGPDDRPGAHELSDPGERRQRRSQVQKSPRSAASSREAPVLGCMVHGHRPAQFDLFTYPISTVSATTSRTDSHPTNNGGTTPSAVLSRSPVFFEHPVRSRKRSVPSAEKSSGATPRTRSGPSPTSSSRCSTLSGRRAASSPIHGAEPPRRPRLGSRVRRAQRRQHRLARAHLRPGPSSAVAVALFLPADLCIPTIAPRCILLRAHGLRPTSGDLALAFDRPVLMVSGDSHDYRVDAGVPWFSLYGARAPNVTQIIAEQSFGADIVGSGCTSTRGRPRSSVGSR